MVDTCVGEDREHSRPGAYMAVEPVNGQHLVKEPAESKELEGTNRIAKSSCACEDAGGRMWLLSLRGKRSSASRAGWFQRPRPSKSRLEGTTLSAKWQVMTGQGALSLISIRHRGELAPVDRTRLTMT